MEFLILHITKNIGVFVLQIYLEKNLKKNIKNDKFKVHINSRFNSNGKLNFGELVIKGKSKKKF